MRPRTCFADVDAAVTSARVIKHTRFERECPAANMPFYVLNQAPTLLCRLGIRQNNSIPDRTIEPPKTRTMPSFLHEALLMLFRNRPALAPKLLRDALHVELPDYTEARIDSADLTDIQPAEYRADLVLLLLHGSPILGIVLEMQLSNDDDKRYVWPAYVANLRARIRCPVCSNRKKFSHCPISQKSDYSLQSPLRNRAIGLTELSRSWI